MSESRVRTAWTEFRASVEEMLHEKNVPGAVIPSVLGGLDMFATGIGAKLLGVDLSQHPEETTLE